MPGAEPKPAGLTIDPAFHIAGLENIDPYAKGTLTVANGRLNFIRDMTSVQIPFSALSGYAIEQDTKGLTHGKKSLLLSLAPFGSGKALSMIRTGVDMLTLEYKDSRGGIRGSILMLPKGSGANVAKLLAGQGVPEGVSRNADPPPAATTASAKLPPLASIQVDTVTLDADTELPAEFLVSIYEQVIDALWRTGSFIHVYRAGDRDAETKPERYVLDLYVDGFKKGNERLRSLTPFTGATVIDARLLVRDTKHAVLIDRPVKGAVHTFGENLDAAHSLAKKVAAAFKR